MPSTYYNLLGYVWLKNFKNQTFRIVPGTNKNLPNGMAEIDKLKLIEEKQDTIRDVILVHPFTPTKTPEEIIAEEIEVRRNQILLNDELSNGKKKLALKALEKLYQKKLKEMKENEKL